MRLQTKNLPKRNCFPEGTNPFHSDKPEVVGLLFLAQFYLRHHRHLARYQRLGLHRDDSRHPPRHWQLSVQAQEIRLPTKSYFHAYKKVESALQKGREVLGKVKILSVFVKTATVFIKITTVFDKITAVLYLL